MIRVNETVTPGYMQDPAKKSQVGQVFAIPDLVTAAKRSQTMSINQPQRAISGNTKSGEFAAFRQP